MDTNLAWGAALAVTGTVALVQTARIVGARVGLRWKLATRQRRASAGEREAERMLAREGYRVIDRQPHTRLTYRLDGGDEVVSVRADLLVSRDGRRYVAEVKTGEVATKLRTVATRRQVLEYAHAFDVDGVLLVDPEAGRIATVGLPARGGAQRPTAFSPIVAFGLGALGGGLAVAWWLLAG